MSDSLVVDDINQAYTELSRRGLTPVSFAENRQKTKIISESLKGMLQELGRSSHAHPKRASKRELPFFTSQLAILLETGTPLAASLQAIERQITCPHWRILVSQLRQHVEEGTSLAAAVEMYPQVFDPVYSSMISAGETSGNLAEILSRLADLSRQADRIRSKIISAMIYPLLLTVITTSVLGVLVFFVLPRFEGIFAEMKVTLPQSTKGLLALSRFLRQHVIFAMGTFVSTLTVIFYWLRSKHGRRFVAGNKLKLPIFGPLIVAVINARVFRLLSLLIESNVPLLQSLELTAKSTKNYLYAELLNRVHENVLNGRTMNEILLQSKIIPASIAQMIHTGEQNGQVGKIMTMLADYLDDQNETKISTLTSIMEPLILIVMGMVVGTIAISLVLPMFDLSRISG